MIAYMKIDLKSLNDEPQYLQKQEWVKPQINQWEETLEKWN